MMYFNALEHGLNELPMADEGLRRTLNRRLDDEGLPALYQELAGIDAETAARVKPTDPQRILRALEVYQLSGQPMSQLLKQQASSPAIDFQRLILDVTDRQPLHRHIHQPRIGMDPHDPAAGLVQALQDLAAGKKAVLKLDGQLDT